MTPSFRWFESSYPNHVGAVVAAPIFYFIKNQSLTPPLAQLDFRHLAKFRPDVWPKKVESAAFSGASFSPKKQAFLGAPALWAIAVVAAPSHLLFSKKRFFGGPGPLGYCSRRCSFTSPFLQKAAFWGPRPFGLLQSSLLLHVSFSPKSGFFGAPALWAIAVAAAPIYCRTKSFPQNQVLLFDNVST